MFTDRLPLTIRAFLFALEDAREDVRERRRAEVELVLHGRLRRVLERLCEEVRGRVRGIRRDVEQVVLSRLADREDDGLLVRLRDFINAPADEGAAEFFDKCVHGETVKAHVGFLFFCRFVWRFLQGLAWQKEAAA